MSNVISLSEYKKKTQFDEKAYTHKILCMHIVDLLDEMIKYSEELIEQGRTVNLTKKGLILFTEIARQACTPELKGLAKQELKKLGAI